MAFTKEQLQSAARAARLKYSPDQPRDDHGRFGEGGGGGDSSSSSSESRDFDTGRAESKAELKSEAEKHGFTLTSNGLDSRKQSADGTYNAFVGIKPKYDGPPGPTGASTWSGDEFRVASGDSGGRVILQQGGRYDNARDAFNEASGIIARYDEDHPA